MIKTNESILKECDLNNICYLIIDIKNEKELSNSIIVEFVPKSSNIIPGVLLDNKLKQDFVRINQEQKYIEKEEEQERQIAKKEALLISKAKKKKKDQKNKESNPYDTKMGELLNQEQEEQRYLGKENIKSLTNRFIKKTMKEILPNTKVFPTIIKEILSLPDLPQKSMELVVLSLEDKNNTDNQNQNQKEQQINEEQNQNEEMEEYESIEIEGMTKK